MTTHKVLYTFETKPIKPNTLRCFFSSRQRSPCGSISVRKFVVAYENTEINECVMHCYQPKHEDDRICFRGPHLSCFQTCCWWPETVNQIYSVEDPGEWDVLLGHLVGIRKSKHLFQGAGSTGESGLRRRGGFQRQLSHFASELDSDGEWEVWTISARGDRTTTPLSHMRRDHLLVSGLGPIERVGERGLAVGLGNVVKIITVGTQRFDSSDSGSDDGAIIAKKASGRKRRNKPRRGTS